jgi:hypothetical protein
MSEHTVVGPDGRYHLEWSDGCYYGRPRECCPLCLGRMIFDLVRRCWRADS